MHLWQRTLGTVLLLLGLGTVAAQEQSTGWTPELAMEFRRIQGSALSPDGELIAYVVSTPMMEGSDSEFRTHIWVASSDGSRNRQYTRGEYSATAPAFSPDGEYLSFISKRGDGEDSHAQVWLMPLFGGEARQLTAAANDVSAYRWAPEGDRIAFTMQDELSEERAQAREEKRDVILVDQQPRYRHLHAAAVDLNGDEPAQSLQITSGDMVVGRFDWSPSGDEIAFGFKPNADLDQANLFGDIATVTVPSAQTLSDSVTDSSEEEASGPPQLIGEIRILLDGNGVEASPLWSPNGAWIAYTSSGSEPNLIGLADVYVVPAQGGDSRRLAQTPNRSANLIGWSGDSSELFLLESMATNRAVIGLPLRGEAIRSVTPETGVAANVALASASDRLSFSWEAMDRPWDMYSVSSMGDEEPQQISDLHADITLPRFARTELLEWNSPDGTAIEGLLTYPVDYRQGDTYPIILQVHGGPSGVFSESFTGGPGIYMTQFFAQQGYAVLRPNPRGSTAYGYEFRAATAGDWGHGDLQDLLAGLDLVIERGIGDPSNQFLMGWSYGGYMTSFAVTQTDRFRAASMGAGLSNLVSMSTTTDIRRYLVEHAGDYFWEDMEAYTRSSAIHHIANVVTPTQVIHGQEDLRVPLGQGQEFYNALRMREIDTEMIIYPRTPHGPREPKYMMDVSPRILAWFEKYRQS